MVRAGVRSSLMAALLVLLLTGCRQDDTWQLKDVAGLLPELRFDLQAAAGGDATAEDFRGHVVLLYFGYTHCPDVCPTTLAELRAALAALGSAGSDVRVLFVSVDPGRDTASVLERYVAYFGPQFVGLRGEPGQLAALAKRYRVVYQPEPGGRDGHYAVAHSSGVFIFDGEGEARLLATEKDSANAIAADLKRLLRSG